MAVNNNLSSILNQLRAYSSDVRSIDESQNKFQKLPNLYLK